MKFIDYNNIQWEQTNDVILIEKLKEMAKTI